MATATDFARIATACVSAVCCRTAHDADIICKFPINTDFAAGFMTIPPFLRQLTAWSHIDTRVRIKLLPLTLGIITVLTLNACHNPAQKLPAAPLNDRPALESLATAYQSVAADFATSPTQLRPTMRRKFVEQVFIKAGFSYTATMLELAKISKDSRTQLHKDMMDLLLLPHYGFELTEVEDIYTDQELNAVRNMERDTR